MWNKIITAWLLFFSTAMMLSAMELVRDGKIQASIVIPPDATEVEQFAAEELSTYIHRITGARLAIGQQPVPGLKPCHIGITTASNLIFSTELRKTASNIRHDGFLIDSTPERMQIIATTRRGLLYGVYYLLKAYGGIYWFHPDDDELVPETPHFAVTDQCTVKNPAFADPSMNAGIWTPPNRLVWRIRNGLSITARDGNRKAPDTVEMRKKLGGRYTTGGHQMTEMLVGYRPKGGLTAARAELFAEHPEYFGLRQGKRVLCGHDILFTKKEPVSQPCTSNPDVIERMTANIQQVLDQDYKGKEITWILCNDDYMFWCECENCTSLDDPQAGDNGKRSDRWWTFVNTLADKLLDKNPNLSFNVLAYQDFRDPPRVVKPDPRVVVTICPHGACYAHALDDPTCQVNASTYYKMFADWIASGAQLHTFEYHTQLPGASQYVPVERQWIELLKFYHRNQFHGFGLKITDGWQPYISDPYYESYHTRYMWQSLWQLAWLSGHFAWNIDDDYDRVWDDVNGKYYGAAWPAMKEYRLLLEKTIAEAGVHLCYGSSTSSTLGVCYERPGVAEKANRLLAEAEKATGNNRIILKRVLRDKEFFRTNWAEAGFSSIGKAENAIALTRAAEAPVIDGRLEETAWLKAARLETFYQLKSSQSLNADPADPPTKVRILYDDKYIYFGLEATKAAGRTEDSAQENGLKALSGSHLEIFLMPPALRGKYYHLGLSHNGKVFSALTTDGKTRNLQDQMDFDYAIHDQPDRWFAELRIPVQKLGGIKEGDFWKFNIGRSAIAKDGKKQLSSIIGHWFHSTEYYRVCAFGSSGPLLLNADFEDLGEPPVQKSNPAGLWKFKTEKVPLHWNFLPANPGEAEVCSESPASGNFCLRILPGASAYPYLTQLIRSHDDSIKKWFLSMKVRGKGNLQVSIYSNRTNKYLARTRFAANSDEWQTFSHTFETESPGPKSLFIRVDKAPLDLDDIRLTPVLPEQMPDAAKHH